MIIAHVLIHRWPYPGIAIEKGWRELHLQYTVGQSVSKGFTRWRLQQA